jgi:hypothetical protein
MGTIIRNLKVVLRLEGDHCHSGHCGSLSPNEIKDMGNMEHYVMGVMKCLGVLEPRGLAASYSQ